MVLVLPEWVAVIQSEAVLFSVAINLLFQVLVIDVIGGKTANKSGDKWDDNHGHTITSLYRNFQGGGVQRQVYFNIFHKKYPHAMKSWWILNFDELLKFIKIYLLQYNGGGGGIRTHGGY